MADNSLGSSMISSVLGFVAREVQDFVVTAVTGAPSTSATNPAITSQHRPKKKLRNAKSFNELSKRAREVKPKRRRSSPHPRAVDDLDTHHLSEGSSDEEPRSSGEFSRMKAPVFKKPTSPQSKLKTNMLPPPPPIRITHLATPKHITMPGSLFPRSPTPAELREGYLESQVPTGPSTTPLGEPVSASNRKARRRSSLAGKVRFATHALQHPPPERSPSPEEASQGPTENSLEGQNYGEGEEEERAEGPNHPNSAKSSAPPKTSEPAITVKEEEDDEIIILDRMPTPPLAASQSKSIERPTTSKGTQQRPARSKPVQLPPISPPSPQRDMSDLSISDLTSKDKGKGKEVYPEPVASSSSNSSRHETPEHDRIKQLEAELERLRAELANRSASDVSLSISGPPPAPPAPPPPPPGYIAIPITSWANGPKHPSQRTPAILKKSTNGLNKSLRATVPMESMDAFLGELKTFKLRKAAEAPAASPVTARRLAQQAASNQPSEVQTGLAMLKAQLKRKRPTEEGQDDLQAAVRRRFELSSPHQEVHEDEAQPGPSAETSFRSTASTGSRNEQEHWVDGQSVSWSYPGPSRPTGSFQSGSTTSPSRVASVSQSQKPPTLRSSNLSAPPISTRHFPGLAPSDITTPSLCSDTEADQDGEQDNDSVERTAAGDEAPTPPPVEVTDADASREDLRRLSPRMPPLKLLDGMNNRGRGSDLQIEDLRRPEPRPKKGPQHSKVQAARVAVSPARPRTPQSSPPPMPSAPLKRSSHQPPVMGTPNIFTARPPKSPLPAKEVPRKPMPPARAAARRSVEAPQAPATAGGRFRLHSSALLNRREESDTEDERPVDFIVPIAQSSEGSTRVRAGTPARPSSTAANDDDEIEYVESEPLHQRPTLPPPRSVPVKPQALQPQQRQSQPLAPRGAKRRVDDSLSLDEELRRVAASERIAELDLVHELGQDEDVYVGSGIKSKHSGFTSGGGGGGIAVTADNSERESRALTKVAQPATANGPRPRSRIPVVRSFVPSRDHR